MPDDFVPAPEEPWSGSVPVALGQPGVVRIPVPGSGGLAVELRSRGWTPPGGSTSTLFIQDMEGRRQLRLDYGANARQGGRVEWHWNQQRVHADFGIANHTTAGPGAARLGRAARVFRHAGRALMVVGAAVDFHSIVRASKPLRRTVQVISAWAAAAVGCQTVGAGGAMAGSAVAPGPGTAVGGIAGCAVGGFIGYLGGEAVGGYVYDWAEGTVFTPLPEQAR